MMILLLPYLLLVLPPVSVHSRHFREMACADIFKANKPMDLMPGQAAIFPLSYGEGAEASVSEGTVHEKAWDVPG
jgi:hypothetical protein